MIIIIACQIVNRTPPNVNFLSIYKLPLVIIL